MPLAKSGFTTVMSFLLGDLTAGFQFQAPPESVLMNLYTGKEVLGGYGLPTRGFQAFPRVPARGLLVQKWSPHAPVMDFPPSDHAPVTGLLPASSPQYTTSASTLV